MHGSADLFQLPAARSHAHSTLKLELAHPQPASLSLPTSPASFTSSSIDSSPSTAHSTQSTSSTPTSMAALGSLFVDHAASPTADLNVSGESDLSASALAATSLPAVTTDEQSPRDSDTGIDDPDDSHHEDAVIFVTPATPSDADTLANNRPSPLKTDFTTGGSLTSATPSPSALLASATQRQSQPQSEMQSVSEPAGTSGTGPLFVSTNTASSLSSSSTPLSSPSPSASQSPLTPQTPHIVNPHNLPFPAHHAPQSVVWASRKVPTPWPAGPSGAVAHKHVLWPAEVLDLEVNHTSNRVKLRYLGVVNALVIIDGESCIPFITHLDRLRHQSQSQDFNEAVRMGLQLINDREQRKQSQTQGHGHGGDASKDSSDPFAAPSHRATQLSNIAPGTVVRLRSADQIHYKLRQYANTDAEVVEVPAHPNTWFSLRLCDGKEVKIRKSAFDVVGSVSHHPHHFVPPVLTTAQTPVLASHSINTSLVDSLTTPSNGGPLTFGDSKLGALHSLSSPSPLSSFHSLSLPPHPMYSRLSTPMGGLGNLMAPMTPLSQMPLSPAAPLLVQQTQKPRALPLDTLVRIKMTPDTAGYPQIIGQDGRIVSVDSANNVYTVKLVNETKQQVILHRTAITSIDPSQPDMESVPVDAHAGSHPRKPFTSPSKFPWNHIARPEDDDDEDDDARVKNELNLDDTSGGSSHNHGLRHRKVVDVSIESVDGDDVKVKITSSPREREGSKGNTQHTQPLLMNVNQSSPAMPSALSQSIPPSASPSMPFPTSSLPMSVDSAILHLAMLAQAAGGSGGGGGGGGAPPMAALLQMQMVMHMLAVNPALAAQIPPMLLAQMAHLAGMQPVMPAPQVPTIIHTGQQVTITHGARTGEVGVIAGVNSENVLVRLGHEEIVKKLSEVEITPGSGNPADFLAAVNIGPVPITPQATRPPLAPQQLQSEQLNSSTPAHIPLSSDADSNATAPSAKHELSNALAVIPSESSNSGASATDNKTLSETATPLPPGAVFGSATSLPPLETAEDSPAPSPHTLPLPFSLQPGLEPQTQQMPMMTGMSVPGLHAPSSMPGSAPLSPQHQQHLMQQQLQMQQQLALMFQQGGMSGVGVGGFHPMAAQFMSQLLAQQQRQKLLSKSSATAKRASMKNLIGKYVQLTAGRYKGDVGMVVKGSNGYFSVRLSQLYADLADTENVVMKRSSDLRAIDAATAHMEMIRRSQAIQAERVMREKADEEERRKAAERKRRKELGIKDDDDVEEAESESDDESSNDDEADANDSNASSSSSDGSTTGDDSASQSSSGEETVNEERQLATKRTKKPSRLSLPSGANDSDDNDDSATSTIVASHRKLKSMSAQSKDSGGLLTGIAIQSKPIPASVKPESLTGMFVLIQKGKYKGEVAVVKSNGHGFYHLDLASQGHGQCKKRSAAIELIVEGEDAIRAAMAAAGRLAAPVAATAGGKGKVGGGGKVAPNGNVKSAASLLMSMTEPNSPETHPDNDTDDTDNDGVSDTETLSTAASTVHAPKKKLAKSAKAKGRAKSPKQKAREQRFNAAVTQKLTALKQKGKRKRDEKPRTSRRKSNDREESGERSDAMDTELDDVEERDAETEPESKPKAKRAKKSTAGTKKAKAKLMAGKNAKSATVHAVTLPPAASPVLEPTNYSPVTVIPHTIPAALTAINGSK